MSKNQTTFTAVQTATAKFGVDELPIDKLMIQACHCPNCKRSLEYFGRSNATEYRAYGVCRGCDYAKLYQVETCALVMAKKEVFKTVNAVI